MIVNTIYFEMCLSSSASSSSSLNQHDWINLFGKSVHRRSTIIRYCIWNKKERAIFAWSVIRVFSTAFALNCAYRTCQLWGGCKYILAQTITIMLSFHHKQLLLSHLTDTFIQCWIHDIEEQTGAGPHAQRFKPGDNGDTVFKNLCWRTTV